MFVAFCLLKFDISKIVSIHHNTNDSIYIYLTNGVKQYLPISIIDFLKEIQRVEYQQDGAFSDSNLKYCLKVIGDLPTITNEPLVFNT